MEVSVLALKALKEIIDDKKQFHIVLERILSEYNLSSEEKKILRNMLKMVVIFLLLVILFLCLVRVYMKGMLLGYFLMMFVKVRKGFLRKLF